jgi:flavin reductase (DIM6/NTAB) family NADH-FMN oxidoreductase RutF
VIVDVQPKPPGEVADTKLLRRAFGTFATGVTVVTVGGDTPHGMTANSFTTVSLDPPLALVCVRRDAILHSLLPITKSFGVSVLSAQQEPVAKYFADRRRPLGADQFDAVDWTPGRYTGAPLIDGALAQFECELNCAYDGGDHTIFVGELLSLERSASDDVLVFFNGKFRQIDQETM